MSEGTGGQGGSATIIGSGVAIGGAGGAGYVPPENLIAVEICRERARQKQLAHGGNTDEFDKQNTQNDWIGYIVAYAGRGVDKCARNQREAQSFRENLVKVGALVLAAIEAYDKGYCPYAK